MKIESGMAAKSDADSKGVEEIIMKKQMVLSLVLLVPIAEEKPQLLPPSNLCVATDNRTFKREAIYHGGY